MEQAGSASPEQHERSDGARDSNVDSDKGPQPDTLRTEETEKTAHWSEHARELHPVGAVDSIRPTAIEGRHAWVTPGTRPQAIRASMIIPPSMCIGLWQCRNHSPGLWAVNSRTTASMCGSTSTVSFTSGRA